VVAKEFLAVIEKGEWNSLWFATFVSTCEDILLPRVSIEFEKRTDAPWKRTLTLKLKSPAHVSESPTPSSSTGRMSAASAGEREAIQQELKSAAQGEEVVLERTKLEKTVALPVGQSESAPLSEDICAAGPIRIEIVPVRPEEQAPSDLRTPIEGQEDQAAQLWSVVQALVMEHAKQTAIAQLPPRPTAKPQSTTSTGGSQDTTTQEVLFLFPITSLVHDFNLEAIPVSSFPFLN